MTSALGNSWLNYEHVDTVVVQGTTVVVAREAHGGSMGMTGSDAIASPFCFNVLLAPEVRGAAPEWVGFKELPFPNELRTVGMELVHMLTSHGDHQYLIPVTDAGGRFRAVPFGKSIYIFRCSTDGTLLSTRFRLVRDGSTATPHLVSYPLERPFDSRFPISQSQETDEDVECYLSLNSEPLCEPTLELSMVRGLSSDSFDVEIVPADGGRAICHVFQVLSNRPMTRVFSLPIDSCGQYELEGSR